MNREEFNSLFENTNTWRDNAIAQYAKALGFLRAQDNPNDNQRYSIVADAADFEYHDPRPIVETFCENCGNVHAR